MTKHIKLARRVAFLLTMVKKKQQSLSVVIETQLAPPQSAPGSRGYINGLSALDAHAYGAI